MICGATRAEIEPRIGPRASAIEISVPGEGGAFAASGALQPGGALPINTHGGLLSHCHPGNPGSMFALTESVWQLRHTAGDRQVANAEVGLVHAQGGIMSSHTALILGREAA